MIIIVICIFILLMIIIVVKVTIQLKSLIIPYNDSISLTLDETHLGTKTTVRFSTDFLEDSMILNGAETEISNRVRNVIEELRRRARKVAIRKKVAATELMKLSRYRFQIVTENNMPTAAGLVWDHS